MKLEVKNKKGERFRKKGGGGGGIHMIRVLSGRV